MSTTVAGASGRTQAIAPRQSKKQARSERIDAALRDALYLLEGSEERWKRLIERGASDLEISHSLTDYFGDGGGSTTDDNIQYAYKGLPGLMFWVDSSSPWTTQKPALTGDRLVKRVREVLSITLEGTTHEGLGSGAIDADGEAADAMAPLAEDGDTAGEERQIIYVDPSRLEHKYWKGKLIQGDIDASYSADRIAVPGKEKIKKPFEHDGVLYICTGSGYFDGEPEADAWRVVPKAEYQGETRSYGGGVRGYEGILVKQGRDEYVLTGPKVIFRPNTARPGDTDTSGDAPDGEASIAESDEADDRQVFDVGGDLAVSNTFKKTIEIELADSDYKAKSRELAFLRLQIDELEAEKKAAVDGYKAKIGGLEEKCAEICGELRAGSAELELEVYESRDFERKVVEIIRADNAQVIESRSMSLRELQQTLPSI